MEGTRTATAFRLTARPRAGSPNRPRIAEACGLKRATEPASKFAAHADAGTPARARGRCRGRAGPDPGGGGAAA